MHLELLPLRKDAPARYNTDGGLSTASFWERNAGSVLSLPMRRGWNSGRGQSFCLLESTLERKCCPSATFVFPSIQQVFPSSIETAIICEEETEPLFFSFSCLTLSGNESEETASASSNTVAFSCTPLFRQYFRPEKEFANITHIILPFLRKTPHGRILDVLRHARRLHKMQQETESSPSFVRLFACRIR